MKSIFTSLLLFYSVWLNGQNANYYSDTLGLGEVVVSASRTEKKASDLALPAVLIYGKQIELSGFTQLNEILAEQTGLMISEDHGSGIQIQGFDPEYTMMLVDGEPMIGRQAGVIDLKRINLRNVARIEVIKGSGSCLYGSDAMAGVINIITKSPGEELRLNVFGGQALPQRSDIGFNIGGKNAGLGWQLFANYEHSRGFDLDPNADGIALGRSRTGSVQLKNYYQLGDYKLQSNLRYYHNVFPGDFYQVNEGTPFYSASKTADASGSISVERRFNKGIKTQFRLYASQYKARAVLEEGASFSDDNNLPFSQQLLNPEFQFDYPYSAKSYFVAGAGARFERLQSANYSAVPSMYTQYLFAQWQYRPWEQMEIISGARFDHGNWFGSRLNPKISFIQKWKKIKLKGSYGYGFKTPDFRQLYLNFTNTAVGYSVLGTEVIGREIDQLEQSGQVANRLAAFDQVGNLAPEISRSLNLGFSLNLGKKQILDVNGFHNHIENLINAVPVAQKSNGQFLYSYVNFRSIVTRGLELNFTYNFAQNWSLKAGGQYLQARDNDARKRVSEGEVFLRENGQVRRMQLTDDAGLIGRSPYAANASLSHSLKKLNSKIYLRWYWRSPYPFVDSNGNEVADTQDEFFPSFHNINLSYQWERGPVALSLSIRNVLNNNSLRYLPGNPGRNFYLSFNYKIK